MNKAVNDIAIDAHNAVVNDAADDATEVDNCRQKQLPP